MLLKYSWVIPGLVMVEKHGRKTVAQEQPWSTMVSVMKTVRHVQIRGALLRKRLVGAGYTVGRGGRGNANSGCWK